MLNVQLFGGNRKQSDRAFLDLTSFSLALSESPVFGWPILCKVCFSLFILADAKHRAQRDPGTAIRAQLDCRGGFTGNYLDLFYQDCVHLSCHALNLLNLFNTETHLHTHEYAKVLKILKILHPQRDPNWEEILYQCENWKKSSYALSDLIIQHRFSMGQLGRIACVWAAWRAGGQSINPVDKQHRINRERTTEFLSPKGWVPVLAKPPPVAYGKATLKYIFPWDSDTCDNVQEEDRASLVAQRLRILLPTQETWIQPLVREDPTCLPTLNLCSATVEPIALEPGSLNCRPMCRLHRKPGTQSPRSGNKRSQHSERPAHRNEE